MDPAIDFILRKMFTIQNLFKDGKEFVEFKVDSDSGIVSGTNSQSVTGELIYKKCDQKYYAVPLFLKVSAEVPLSETINLQLHLNEVYFYTRINRFFHSIRSTKQLLPTFYMSHLDVNDETSAEILVFDNLRNEGFVTYKGTKSFPDYDHLVLMMRKLGEFQAYSLKARDVDEKKFSLLVHSLKNTIPLFIEPLHLRLIERWRMAAEPLRHESQFSKGLQNLDEILENFSVDGHSENSSTTVLCHQSYTVDNVLFRYDGEKPVDMRILDWQTTYLGPMGIDALVVLYVNADQKMRDKHWDSLIDEYCHSLSNTFPDVNVPNEDAIMANLKMKLVDLLLIGGCRVPHKNFSAYKKVLFTETKITSEPYVDPLTDVLKDLIKRNLLV